MWYGRIRRSPIATCMPVMIRKSSAWIWPGTESHLQIFETFRRDHFRAFGEVEYFHRNHSVIPDFVQCSGNRFKINFSEPRALEVFIVGMKMGEVGPGIADDFRDGFCL